eukprot:3401065-Rhodomonas_salina.1
MMNANIVQASSVEDDWMERHMHGMVAERSWVGATVCERHLLLNPAVAWSCNLRVNRRNGVEV